MDGKWKGEIRVGRVIYTSVLWWYAVDRGYLLPMPVLALGIRRRAAKRGICSPVRTASTVSSSSSSEVSLTLLNGRSSSGRISFGSAASSSRTRFGVSPVTTASPPQPSSTSSASVGTRPSETSTGSNQRFGP